MLWQIWLRVHFTQVASFSICLEKAGGREQGNGPNQEWAISWLPVAFQARFRILSGKGWLFKFGKTL